MTIEYRLSHTASEIDRKLTEIDSKVNIAQLPEAIEEILKNYPQVTQTSQVFIAIYGETTYSEIIAAKNAGKVCFSSNSESSYFAPMCSVTSDVVYFCYVDDYGTIYADSVTSSNTWNSNIDGRQKVTGISGSSTDNQIPTAKAVHKAISSAISNLEIAGAENNVFIGDDNTTVAEYFEADQGGKVCFMVRPRGGSGNWTWVLVNVNQSLARFYTIDNNGNVMYGTLTAAGAWTFETKDSGNVFIGDANTTVAEYHEAYQAGKACFMKRAYGPAGNITWVASACNVNSTTFFYVKSADEIIYGTLSSDGTWTTTSANLGTGVSSWNDLTDKPFDEEITTVNSDTITWDGNTEGSVTFKCNEYGIDWYKVSDVVPTLSELESATVRFHAAEDGVIECNDDLDGWVGPTNNGNIEDYLEFDWGDDVILVVISAVGTWGAPETGIYFAKNTDDAYTHSITIPGYKGFKAEQTVVTPLDEKYIPDTIATKAYVDEVISERLATLTNNAVAENWIFTLEDGSTVRAVRVLE